MLVLTVAMYAMLARLLIILPVLGSVFQAQQTPGVLMTQPVQGESVRGVVQVMGSAVGEGFSSYDLVYSFENSESPNWFSITSANQTVETVFWVTGTPRPSQMGIIHSNWWFTGRMEASRR